MDYSIEYINKPNSLKISLEYAGADALYLAGTFIFYLIIMVFIELFAYSFREVEDGLIKQNSDKKLDKKSEIPVIFISPGNFPNLFFTGSTGIICGSDGKQVPDL